MGTAIILKSIIISMMGIMIEKDEIYHRAINKIEMITKLIDEEIN